jgi:serine O-acetyltransferase
MALDGRTKLLKLARMWAFPLWWCAMRSASAEALREDVDWWAKCIDNEELISLDPFSKFAYFTGALTEFRTLVHYRIKDLPLPLRLLLKMIYRPPEHMILAADSIGPGFFIQHGHGMLIGATTIGHHCWINQDVTVGYMDKGNPTLGNNVRIAPGAVILGPITLHDGATIGPNAVVTRDVAPGEVLVGPLAQPVKRKSQNGVGPE